MHGLQLYLPCGLSTSVPLPERRTPANPKLVLKPKGMQLLVSVFSTEEVFFLGLLKIWRIGGKYVEGFTYSCGWPCGKGDDGDKLPFLTAPANAISKSKISSLLTWSNRAVFITFILKKAPKLLEEREGSSGGFNDVIYYAPGVPVMEDGWALLTPLLPQAGALPGCLWAGDHSKGRGSEDGDNWALLGRWPCPGMGRVRAQRCGCSLGHTRSTGWQCYTSSTRSSSLQVWEWRQNVSGLRLEICICQRGHP